MLQFQYSLLAKRNPGKLKLPNNKKLDNQFDLIKKIPGKSYFDLKG